jgi:hypothetical protein
MISRLILGFRGGHLMMMILFWGRCTERFWGDVNVSDILRNVDKITHNHTVQRSKDRIIISDQQGFCISNKSKQTSLQIT